MLFRGRFAKMSDKFSYSASPAVIFLALIVLLLVFPAGAAADQAVVKETVVNLRSAPGTGSSVVGQAAQGETLEVLGKEGDWYKVGRNGTTCWVAGWLVDIRREAGSGSSGQVVVKEPAVNLRSAPNAGSSLVGQAAQGEVLEVLGKEGDWYRVRRNGTACWVAGWLVEIKQNANPGGQGPTASGGSTAFTGEVTEDGVNIRSGPGPTHSILGHAGKGNKYSLLDKSGDWYKISINSGSGWISGQYVKVQGGSVSTGGSATDISWAVINGIGVNIRNGPGTSYQVVTSANRGDRFLLADRSSEWYKVVLDNGKPGWVAGWLVDVEKGPSGNSPRPVGDNPVGRGQQLVPPSRDTANQSPPGEKPEGTGQQLVPPSRDTVSPNPSGEKPAGAGQTIVPPQAPGGTGSIPPSVLKSVSARVEGSNTIITARAEKGPLNYEITSLNNPDRLVIDLKGLEPGQVPETITVSSPLAGGIRVGWFSRNPNVTRIVVDLKSGIKYDRILSSDSGQLNVVLMPRVSRSLSGATIVLDPGHGGSDPGAIGPSGLKEKDVNLGISLKAAEYLRKEGAKVILTRTGDSYVDLAERPNVASRNGAALFVSIHSNANPNGAMNGTSTYYLQDAAQGMDQVRFESMYLAKNLQTSLVQALKRPDRGVLRANFLVLVKSSVPAALVEVAYMSNSEEEKMLRDGAFQDKAAQAIAKGIADFMAAR